MLCVLAMLSAEAEKKLEQLREKALPGVKFSPLHAHITLATWLPEDAGAFMDACKSLLQNVAGEPAERGRRSGFKSPVP